MRQGTEILRRKGNRVLVRLVKAEMMVHNVDKIVGRYIRGPQRFRESVGMYELALTDAVDDGGIGAADPLDQIML